MSEKIVFQKLVRENVYCSDFENLTINNVIEFKRTLQNRNQGIVVIYGPNGIGKTSLVKNLENNESNSEFELEFDDQIINDNDDDTFHCIHDQNSRNIIEGKTEDFLLGDNIRREYGLKEQLEDGFKKAFKSNVQKTLKDVYKIKKQSANLLKFNSNTQLVEYAKNIVNSQSVGKRIDRRGFIDFIESLSFNNVTEPDDNEVLDYVCRNYIDNNSILAKILNIG